MLKKWLVAWISLTQILSPVVQSASMQVSNEQYETWTAQEKSDAIWDRVMATQGRNSWWMTPFKVLATFFVNFDDVFERTDFVQYSWWSLWMFPRWKTLHTVGTVQRVSWVPEPDQPFSGMFKGAQDGIIRYSLGGENNEWIKGTMFPSFALKLFRNGMHSANVHTGSTLSGIDSFNFFQKNFSNHNEEIRDHRQLGAWVFATGGSDFPVSVGLNDFAKFDQSGQEETDIKYPFRLVFEPMVSTPDRNPQWPGWTEETKSAPFQQDLVDSLTQTNQLLFKVYAYTDPWDLQDPSKIHLVGKLFSRSAAVNSLFGDEELLFAHSKMEEDLQSHPVWEQYLPKYTANFFEIEWYKEKNPRYIARVQSENPREQAFGLVGKVFDFVMATPYQKLFGQRKARCPYGYA